MTKNDFPVTPAVRFLRQHNISFEPFLYDYKEHGGTSHSAQMLGVSEHIIIKTLIMETNERQPLIVLMHGDREVSTQALARTLAVKDVRPCDPATAQKHTGYLTGGTSPFGTRAKLPVYAERTIFDLPSILINAGKRGFLMQIDPQVLKRLLPLQEVEVKRAA